MSEVSIERNQIKVKIKGSKKSLFNSTRLRHFKIYGDVFNIQGPTLTKTRSARNKIVFKYKINYKKNFCIVLRIKQ